MKKLKQTKTYSLRVLFSKFNNDDPLSKLIYSTTSSWYKAKHPSSTINEVELINSLPVDDCPYCKSKIIIKIGKRNDGVQRYKCKNCQRKFNPLTGTLFDSRKIPISEWIEFLLHIFQYESMLVSSIDNRNA